MRRSARLISLVALSLMLGASPLQAEVHAFSTTGYRRGESSGHIVNGLLGARVRALIAMQRVPQHRQKSVGLPVIVESTKDATAAIRMLGGKVSTSLGGTLVTASVPAAQIRSLARQPGIQEIYPDQVLQPLLDRSVPEIGATSAWALSAPSGLHLHGNGVLVGVVDSGIDYRNPDFKNPDGSTRIKYIWDQTQSGSPPAGYDFGVECDSASIDTGTCPEHDIDGHGTHVAGIAAGNGRSSMPAREIGVAPESDIIVVKSEMTTSKVIAAWEYLINKAHELREPIVINNSFGSAMSPHDGSSPLSLAADRLSAPGVIFVAAAGNDGNQGLHTDGSLVQGDDVSIPFSVDGASRLQLGFFYPAQDAVQIGLANVNAGESSGPLDLGQHLDTHLKSGETVSLVSGVWDSRYHFFSAQIEPANGGPLTGHYALLVKAPQIVNTARFDAWLSSDVTSAFGRPDESDTVSTPADSHQVISVSNYATRTDWIDRNNQSHSVCDGFPCLHGTLAVGDIASYSSVGPTADGRQKPDIAAPGTMIISSLSRDAAICSSLSEDNCLSPKLLTPDGKNMIATGTSMSSPHVAGVVALMLQVNPTLTYDAVLTILKTTARHDQFTGDAPWTPTFGAGKVDAYAAAKYVLQQEQSQPLQQTAPTPGPVPPVQAVPTSFHVISIHGQRSNANLVNGPMVSQSRVGHTVWLSIYFRVNSVPAHSQATATFVVSRNREFIESRDFDLSLSGALPRIFQSLDLYKLDESGSYTIVGRITINGVSQKATMRILVKK